MVITRATALTQNTDYVANDAFSADSTEFALDRLTVGIQDVKAGVGRSLRVADHLPAINPIADPDAPVLAWATQPVSVTAYGAVGDDLTDSTAAFTAALALGRPVFVPAGTYRISSSIAISASGSGLIGQGREVSEIKIVSTTAKAITIANGLTRVILKGIRVTREGVPVAGADGIDCSTAILGTSTFEDIACEGHWDGVSLGVTDYSYLNNVLTKKNYRDGIRMTNVGTNGQLQWNLHQCLSQLNDGNGYHVLVDGSAGQVTLGNWDSCSTYANTGNGVRAVGSASMPVQGLRLNNCYVGEDNGGAGVYLDTHGTFHRIIGCFIELCGRVATGRTASTAATNTGPGIWATANNNALTVSDTRIDSCSYDGIQSGARAFNASGCDITDNGLALTANRRNGIKLISGTSYASIMGGTSGHRSTGTSQQFVLEAVSATGTTMMGVAVMNIGSGIVTGPLPNLIGNTVAGHFIVSDGLILGTPTGSNKGAGTLNSAGDQYKNNTAYTNP